MNTADFDYVRTYVRDQAAIVLEPGKEYLVESRLLVLTRKEGFSTLGDLVSKLRANPRDILHRKVVDAMTTNETSFFRDIHPFETLRKTILPDLIARRSGERRLNLWCGAASTGQEPYSVMMLIAEHFPDLLRWDIKFIASDLCRDVLDRARSGRFSQLEVNRGLPAKLLIKYFFRHGTDWEIREDLRKRVDFTEMNLVKDWPWMPQMDLILLRNVLIYFDADSKRSIFANIRRLMKPDAYLLLGSAETPFNLHDGFERTVFENTPCYHLKQG